MGAFPCFLYVYRHYAAENFARLPAFIFRAVDLVFWDDDDVCRRSGADVFADEI